jgi:amino acid adenylation domain-containing protein
MGIGEGHAADTSLGVDSAPLSFAQEQLWFIDQLSPGETAYNILLTLRLRGPLDLDALRDSLTFVVARHPALRTSMHAEDGAPYQVVAAPHPVDLAVVDAGARVAATAEPDRDALIRELVAGGTGQPFDLSEGPLYRFTVIRLGDHDHVFCQELHHSVTDGWSSGILNAELSAVYDSLLDGVEPKLAEPATTYLEYARQQRERLRGEYLDEELRFWEERLANLPTLELPTDRPRPGRASNRGGSVRHVFPAGVLDAAHAVARDQGVPLFMILAAAFNVVLSRYSGQVDIPVGIPMLGRPEPELEDVVGMFINMVVLRTDLSGDPTFAELLERIGEANLDLYEHQEVPFHLIVDRVQPVRDPGRNPLFQVAVQVLSGDTSGQNLRLGSADAEFVEVDSVSSQFDLTLNFVASADSLKVSAEYATDLFDRWRIEGLLRHVENVLVAVLADPSLALSRIPLLSPAERDELLAVGHGDLAEYSDASLPASVTEWARRQPDAVAVVCRGVELTYAELDRRSDQLARYLRGAGVRHGDVVAVLLDRDLDAYVTMVGVLKAGGAYAILDPQQPTSRLDYMIRDTAAPVVITRSVLRERLPESTGRSTVPAESTGPSTVPAESTGRSILLIDTDWPAVESVDADGPLDEWTTPGSLAYVLYTSGSTGTPKGVMIPHRAVAFFAEAYRRSFGFGPHDRLLQLPQLHFDMSQGELWTAFLVGATVVAVSPEEVQSPEALALLMREQRVTYAGLPKAMLTVLPPEPYPALRYIMGGAELLPPELVNQWNLPGRTFLNLYGPTEATIACTEYVCEHKVWQTSPPIGRPHINRQVYVVDEHGNLVPRGIAGELLIGGEDGGLALGYLNQPEQTTEKFVADPFRPDGRVYRSGDLVRWNEDFQIEFLGRVDNQVKLRGLRIELGEIESALTTHPLVRMSAVLMLPDRQGEDRLVGYVTPDGGDRPTPQDLRQHLADRLPEYMIPTAWMVLDEFPLISAWKINRKALPPPVEPEAADAYLAPRTATEQTIASIFAQILSLPRVGAEDSFFGIGGNSLQALRVVSRINKTFAVKTSIRMLYGTATVATIATAVDDLSGGDRAGGGAGSAG